ncbi:hypothetical protein GH714_032032 [Hevea brasiliensis]|uniref:Uncharacterized protein n=1 Tax=Hevea brasiliensis TaxID=3981 RepID=A0A6A6N9N1_HEVBR|nr:hypothetical protein GH714_032032 [Hevea brasiliensis]
MAASASESVVLRTKFVSFGPAAKNGYAIDVGPPIGSALVDKLDLLANWIFMPIYLVKNGLVINVFSVKLKNYLIVQSIALISSFGKFLGTFLASSYSNIPLTDAASLGLVMNAQGVLELGMFKMMKKNKAIDNEAFVIMAVSMMLVTGAITPIIKYLYDPSRRTSLNSQSTYHSQSSYSVALLFLGGPDDREALAIGARMAGHHSINLTMIRLLEYGSITNDNARRRRLDNEVVSEFRTATAGNYRVKYIEEVVMDGTGTTSVIRSMENRFELVIVGRHHDNKSPIVSGLADWNDYKELGTIGDLLVSSQFMDKTTILVVQQHNNVINEGCEIDRTVPDFEAEDLPIFRRVTW